MLTLVSPRSPMLGHAWTNIFDTSLIISNKSYLHELLDGSARNTGAQTTRLWWKHETIWALSVIRPFFCWLSCSHWYQHPYCDCKFCPLGNHNAMQCKNPPFVYTLKMAIFIYFLAISEQRRKHGVESPNRGSIWAVPGWPFVISSRGCWPRMPKLCIMMMMMIIIIIINNILA